MTEDKSTDIANASQSATLREEFENIKFVYDNEKNIEIIWNWVQEHLVPREDVEEKEEKAYIKGKNFVISQMQALLKFEFTPKEND